MRVCAEGVNGKKDTSSLMTRVVWRGDSLSGRRDGILLGPELTKKMCNHRKAGEWLS